MSSKPSYSVLSPWAGLRALRSPAFGLIARRAICAVAPQASPPPQSRKQPNNLQHSCIAMRLMAPWRRRPAGPIRPADAFCAPDQLGSKSDGRAPGCCSGSAKGPLSGTRTPLRHLRPDVRGAMAALEHARLRDDGRQAALLVRPCGRRADHRRWSLGGRTSRAASR